jgi:hypothetical protein
VGIAFTGGSLTGTIGVTWDLGTTNVKVDLVNSDAIQSSVSAALTDAAVNLMLWGINTIDGTGNAPGNLIAANMGANILMGLGGNDILLGGYRQRLACLELC